MASAPDQLFADRGSPAEVEGGLVFQPKFDADGLIPAIVTDAASGEVLMLAWMNAEALALTLETRVGHFWSRSRRKLWKKGEESGNLLRRARDAHRLRPGCRLAQGRRLRERASPATRARGVCFYRTLPLGTRPGPGHATSARLIVYSPCPGRPRGWAHTRERMARG